MFFQGNEKYNCATYLRLSRSDGDQQESNSIKNQRALLNDYMGKHPELHKFDEYVDDGYSGTNFERPDFKRMMQDIEKRNVNCIIVKDLSRFGRNYIETGRYLERIFPFMGVRFIAINDHYDSAEENDDKGRILIPFNNLINDTYCRDISLRVRSHLDVKRKEGQFIGSFAGYGYRKDPKDKNHLIIDEYAAGIVQEIFKQKLNGMSSQRIASHLNELGVLPPNEYKRANGFNYTCGFQAGLNQKWTVVSVNRILKNESYTGTLIQGKRRKINYKVKKSHDVGSENWIRVEDAHDAIISKGEFQQVQQLLELDTRTAPSQTTVYPLSGFLRCADCGQNMIRRTVTKNGKKYQYYHCSTYKKNEIKSHHYIISFDPRDSTENCLTGKRAQELGLEYAKANFPGHQALVCTHMDGHNGSGNIHVHIVINSLRKLDVPPQPFMERPIDCKAGYKHHVTNEYLKHLQKSLMDLCNREFLHQVDLLSPSRTGVTEAEYWAQRRLDEKKREIEKEGFTPNPTKFKTQKQLIRDAVAAAREKAISYEDFQNILQDEYDIFVKIQRGRYSYLPPERNKFISERSLGESCKREYLEGFFIQNAERNLRYKEDPILIFTTRTRLRLVVDLQENVKAQENLAYALKVKISNLQKMAETLVWVQENNINDLTELNDLCKTAQANAQAAYERLSQAEDELYKTNEQIHYAGQYLSTKEVQQQFTKAIFKKKFRAEHSKELDAYAESVKYFREENDGKLPSLKSLKKRKEELTKEIAERKKAYVPLKEESRRLEIASDNVYSIFRKTNEMKSDLAWKREWEAKVREKARQEQARQEQRERQPKRKKRSYDMSL